jgi:NAD+ synthase (glutamine-hydrolysing)
VVSPAGEVLARAPQFAEALVVCDVPLARGSADPAVVPAASLDVPPPRGVAEATIAEVLGPVAEVYGALVLGLRDYVEKNGFERVLVGVSGGVDSALVATVAADALGPDRVACAVMPSPHSSEATQADARTLVANLGAELLEFPIEPAMRAYEVMLDGGTGPPDRGEHGTAVGTGGRTTASDLAAENIQARIRGNVLMAISNRRGWLVLTTGNKSEMSVGYATLYGDMAGGFAVIKDVPKTLVYELCRYRNSLEPGGGPIPEAILGRAPSAELRPDQRDEDSLPPYAVLDPILEAYVEEDRSRDEIVAAGADPEVVDEVLAMVDRAEYKRRQAPPGVKITPRAFGRDRRLPITNRFRG